MNSKKTANSRDTIKLKTHTNDDEKNKQQHQQQQIKKIEKQFAGECRHHVNEQKKRRRTTAEAMQTLL